MSFLPSLYQGEGLPAGRGEVECIPFSLPRRRVRDEVVHSLMPNRFFNLQNKKGIRRKLRKEMPEGENRVWKVVKNNNLGYKFRRQYGIGPFVADFCCPQIKLVIEVDGLSHDDKSIADYDQWRQKYLENNGFTVIRFTSTEAFSDLQDIAKKITGICQSLDR